jgi:hypothetical protein
MSDARRRFWSRAEPEEGRKRHHETQGDDGERRLRRAE